MKAKKIIEVQGNVMEIRNNHKSKGAVVKSVRKKGFLTELIKRPQKLFCCIVYYIICYINLYI